MALGCLVLCARAWGLRTAGALDLWFCHAGSCSDWCVSDGSIDWGLGTDGTDGIHTCDMVLR